MKLVPRIITHNASLKLLAFVGAVVLWAVVPGEPQGGEVLSDVPVRVQVADLAWVPAAAPEPAVVQVRISGPTREIIRLAREGTSVRVPLDRITSTDTVITLRRDWVVLAGAPGVVVEEVAPGAVRLQFEEALSKAVPLVVPTTGQLPPGLALAAPLGVTPVLARVRGPSRLVEPLEAVSVEPLDLGGIRASGILEIAVDTAGLGGLLVTPGTASVGVRVEAAAAQLLTGLPVELMSDPGYPLIMDPSTADVRVSGAPGRLAASPLGRLRVVVDAGLALGLAPGESLRLPVRVLDVPSLLSATPVPDSVTLVRRLVSGRERE